MDTHQQTETLSLTSESYLLGMKAKQEYLTERVTRTKCPKCLSLINVTVEGRFEERVVIRCKCGYIGMMELGI